MMLWVVGGLGVLLLLFGVGTILWFIDQSLARRYGWSHVRTMISTFGAIGLAIPLVVMAGSALDIDKDWTAPFAAVVMICLFFWPTSIFWMVGPGGLLGIGWAILTNVLLYALGGWFVGGIWQMIHDLRSGEQ